MARGSQDHFAAVLAQLEAQRASIDNAIAALKAVQSGGPIPVLGHTAVPQQGTESTEDIKIEIDTFHALTVANSIKKYLGMRGRKPATTQEIVEALSSGGQKSADGANFSVVVTNSLKRMSAADGEISKVRRGVWGLKAWYSGKGNGE